MGAKKLHFTYEEVKLKFKEFVSNFLSGEVGVERTEIFPQVYIVVIPSADFKVLIKCEEIGDGQWCAVVQEPSGDKTKYLLFKEEIDNWLDSQR